LQRWGQVEKALTAVLALWVAIFVGLKLPHVFSADWIEWDARAMVLAAFRFHGTGLFPRDLGVDLSSAMCPPGWKLLYWFGSFFMGPYQVSRILPLITFSFLLWQTYKLARGRGGLLIAAVSVYLVARCPFFWDRMVGANPRGFGLPLVVAFLRYASERRSRAAGIVLVAQAAFYPSVMMFCAPAFALYQLYEAHRERSWRPILLLVTCGLGCIALSLPTLLLADPRLGSPIRIEELAALRQRGMWSLYPLPPHSWVLERGLHITLDDSFTEQYGTLSVYSALFFRSLVAVVLGLALLRRRIPLIFPCVALCAAAAYMLASAVAYRLYVPDRMIHYALPPLVLLLLAPMALEAATLVPVRFLPQRARATVVVLALVLPTLAFGGLGFQRENGLRDWGGEDTRAMHFLNGTSRDALVAAHPATSSFVEVFGQRSALFSGITNAPNFNRYGHVVEDRISAFYDAYYASKLDGVRAFAQKYAIDYLVVDTRDFGPDARKRAIYASPWTEYALALVSRARNHFSLAHPPAETIAFRDGPILVLDGKKLASGRY
jgi:hypothetical protein